MHIGFINEEPKEPNNVEFYTGYKGKKFVIEVKSTNKESFNKDGLRQDEQDDEKKQRIANSRFRNSGVWNSHTRFFSNLTIMVLRSVARNR